MKNAISEAKKCIKDVPVGCVIKQNGKIIVAAHNMREESCDITAHAEIIAIRKAHALLKTTHLNDCEMYVTLEPCPMCSWAIIQSKIKTLYFGTYNTQYGGMGSVINLAQLANSKIKIYGGIEEDICNKILKNFFEGIR